MKNLLLLITFSQFGWISFSQQDPYLNLEGFTPLTFNPASYGQRNTFSINTIGYLQWDRVDGAPAAFFANSEYRLYHDARENSVWSPPIGLGVNYMYHQYGYFDFQSINFQLNKGIYLGGTYLSFGVSPGLFQINLDDTSWLNPPQTYNDPNLPEPGSQWKFDMGAGLFWYGENFFLGISSMHLTEQYYDKPNFSIARHYYAHGGYRFNFEKFSLYPMSYFGYVGGFQLLSTKLYAQFFDEMLTIGGGISWRSKLDAAVMLKYKWISLGYNLGFYTSPLTNAFRYSHELRLSYTL